VYQVRATSQYQEARRVTTYDCQVPGCEFGTHSRLGVTSHAHKHKNQFEEITGRRHDDYDEVKELLAGQVGPNGDIQSEPRLDPPGDQTQLQQFTFRRASEL